MITEYTERREVPRLPGSPRRVLFSAIGVAVVGVGVFLLAGQFFVMTVANHQGISASASGGHGSEMDLVEMWQSRDSTPARVGGDRRPPVSAQTDSAPGPFIIRTIRITMAVNSFDAVRQRLEALVRDAGGTVATISTYAEPNEPRVLTASIHIPSSRVDAAVTSVRAIGRVAVEQQEAADVTRQVVDLDARLLNLRTAEERLRSLLERRTGSLADVLSAERELTRVRGEVEAMEAGRRLLGQQTAFATVNLEIREERTAALDMGGASAWKRLRNAAVDGGSMAARLSLGLVLLVVRFGPAVIVLVLSAIPLIHVIRTVRRRRAAAAPL